MIGKKSLIATLAAVLMTGVWDASAVPAYPRPVVCTLSDGTQITIRMVGDEYNHYVLSEEGYTLTGGEDGDYYYADLASDGSLVPTAVKARPTSMLTRSEAARVSSLQRGLKPTAASQIRMNRKMAPMRMPLPTAVTGSLPQPPGRASTAATTGKLRSLVILIETTDKSFSVASPKQAFTDMLNQKGYSQNGAMGSAWDYYNENSNGDFDPEFVVVGPYRVSKRGSYYAGQSGSDRVPDLIVEACELADRDGVDFTQFADNGVIRDIFVFYAGHNQAEGAANTIWPHRWSVDAYSKYDHVLFDGVQLLGYACSSELKGAGGTSMAGIGTFCHEFGHVLGWPDFYDTDYEGSGGVSEALENYVLMCSGSYNNDGRTPPALSMLERWMVGWAQPELLAAEGDYTLGPVWEDKGYLVPTGTNDEYFLLEARALGGFKWDNYIDDYYGNIDGSKGLLVFHIDYTSQYQDAWVYSNDLNSNPNHECAKLVRSVPGKSSADMPSRTFFPGEQKVMTLTSTSNRDYLAWNGREPEMSFTGITVDDQTVKMKARLRSGGSTGEFGLLVRANQFDALLTWDGAATDTWKVEWVSISGGEDGEMEVEGTSLYLDKLAPSATYEITLTALSGEQKDKAQIYEITTSALDTNKTARINIPHSTFGTTEPVMMSILDYSGTVKRVDWYVDGKLYEEHYTTLPQGEHRLVAAIVADDGTKEYLVKYITVK